MGRAAALGRTGRATNANSRCELDPPDFGDVGAPRPKRKCEARRYRNGSFGDIGRMPQRLALLQIARGLGLILGTLSRRPFGHVRWDAEAVARALVASTDS